MAPHSSTFAWKIPWTEEPGGLQSMGSLRVGHGCATSLSLFSFMHWRRKWQPTPVLLPGKSHGLRSPVGYSPWGHKESDTTEQLHFTSLFPDSKESACSAGDLGSIPGSGRSPGEGNGNPLQYSCLENPMQRSLSQESDTT